MIGLQGASRAPQTGIFGGQVTLSPRLAGNTKEGRAPGAERSRGGSECARLAVAAVSETGRPTVDYVGELANNIAIAITFARELMVTCPPPERVHAVVVVVPPRARHC
ncbi:unnamed protein product [Merluccius merluccius]